MEFTDRLIIIPKCKIIEKLLKLPNLILGLPCGRFRNQWTRYYADNLNLPIHLLGGSPKQWRNEINNYANRVYSMDGNYLCKIASYGKVYLNFISRKPYIYEVVEGKDFIYRCYHFSLQNFNVNDLISYQLNLIV